jgi:membrane fusion protein, multidrug efflux system
MGYKLILTACAGAGLAVAGTWLWQHTPVFATAPAAAASPATPVAAAMPVDVYVVAPEALEVLVPATGTLLARESVELVSELTRRLASVRAEEGTAVARGAVLFELDAADLRAELGKTEVQGRLARATLERTQSLLGEGISNQQELDLAQARVDELAAERQVLGVTLAKTQIRAPFAGTLGLRRVSEGAWLSPSTVLATLQDTSSLKLDFTLPERYAGLLASGGSFRFHVEGRAATYAGKISALEPIVDAVTRSILVRGVIQADTGLLPGSSASIEVPLRVEQAVLVPALAIVPGVEGRKVFVADQGVVRSVPVEVGFRTADRAQLLSGVKPGDQVIVSNLLRLRDGAAVTPNTQPVRP